MVKISLSLSGADLHDMGLNIKHGLIAEQDINNIAGLLTCRYIRPCIFFDFVCDRLCFCVYTVVE